MRLLDDFIYFLSGTKWNWWNIFLIFRKKIAWNQQKTPFFNDSAIRQTWPKLRFRSYTLCDGEYFSYYCGNHAISLPLFLAQIPWNQHHSVKLISSFFHTVLFFSWQHWILYQLVGPRLKYLVTFALSTIWLSYLASPQKE